MVYPALLLPAVLLRKVTVIVGEMLKMSRLFLVFACMTGSADQVWAGTPCFVAAGLAARGSQLGGIKSLSGHWYSNLSGEQKAWLLSACCVLGAAVAWCAWSRYQRSVARCSTLQNRQEVSRETTAPVEASGWAVQNMQEEVDVRQLVQVTGTRQHQAGEALGFFFPKDIVTMCKEYMNFGSEELKRFFCVCTWLPIPIGSPLILAVPERAAAISYHCEKITPIMAYGEPLECHNIGEDGGREWTIAVPNDVIGCLFRASEQFFVAPSGRCIFGLKYDFTQQKDVVCVWYVDYANKGYDYRRSVRVAFYVPGGSAIAAIAEDDCVENCTIVFTWKNRIRIFRAGFLLLEMELLRERSNAMALSRDGSQFAYLEEVMAAPETNKLLFYEKGQQRYSPIKEYVVPHFKACKIVFSASGNRCAGINPHGIVLVTSVDGAALNRGNFPCVKNNTIVEGITAAGKIMRVSFPPGVNLGSVQHVAFSRCDDARLVILGSMSQISLNTNTLNFSQRLTGNWKNGQEVVGCSDPNLIAAWQYNGERLGTVELWRFEDERPFYYVK